MLRVLTTVGALFALASPVLSQDVAAVNPQVSLAQIDSVVSQCEIVAADPEIADSANGICIGATRDYLAGVLPGAEEPVQQLVIRLLELSQLFPDCDPFDDELGAAIREAAVRLPEDSELRPDLLAAAEVLETCEVTNLGAIAPAVASPVTPG